MAGLFELNFDETDKGSNNLEVLADVKQTVKNLMVFDLARPVAISSINRFRATLDDPILEHMFLSK